MRGREIKQRTRSVRIIAAAASCAIGGLASRGFGQVLYHPVVQLIGDGTANNDTQSPNPALGVPGATVTIEIFNDNTANQTSPITTMAYPSANPNNGSTNIPGNLVDDTVSTTEGSLTNNPALLAAAETDQPFSGTTYLYSAGYSSYDAVTNVNGINVANRVIGYMSVANNVLSTPVIAESVPDSAVYGTTGNNRTATGNDTATEFWAAGTGAGSNVGFEYFNNGTATQLSSAPLNTRFIQDLGGQLYGSSDTGVGGSGGTNGSTENFFVGISKIGTGEPTTSGQTSTSLFDSAGPPNGVSNSGDASPFGFILLDDPNNPLTPAGVPYNVAYVADGGEATTKNDTYGGGIQKWVYTGATTNGNNGWVEDYTLTDGTSGGFVDLTGQLVANSNDPQADEVVLWTTSTNTTIGTPFTQNRLEEFVDPLEGTSASVGVTTSQNFITLATAPAHDRFAGVALAPGGASLPAPALPNNGTLTLSPTQNANVTITDTAGYKSAVVTVGSLVNIGTNTFPVSEDVVLKGGSAATTGVVLTTNGIASFQTTDYFISSEAAPNGAHGSVTGPDDPIPSGKTDTAQIGLNATDTGQIAVGGSGASGTVTITNVNNPSDPPITITTNPVTVLEQRTLSAASEILYPAVTQGVNVAGNNKGILILPAGTGGFKSYSTPVQILTYNTDTNGDYSSDVLTTETIKANAVSTPFLQTDPFTGNAVATISATAPNIDQVFGGPDQQALGAYDQGASWSATTGTAGTYDSNAGLVTLTVTPTASGIYGTGNAVTIGSVKSTNDADFTTFSGPASITGMNLEGETDTATVYAQWSAFQPALVTVADTTSNTSAPAQSGDTITLTNNPSTDNVYNGTLSSSPVNLGQRADAWVTSVSIVDGWSQGGFNVGNDISGGANGSSQSAGLNFNTNSNMINGTYGGSFVVGLENEQDIEGATPNDLGNVSFPLASQVVVQPGGFGDGNYSFTFGTLNVSTSVLTGSFTQYGGTVTFAGINPSTGGLIAAVKTSPAGEIAPTGTFGQVTLNGGLTVLAPSTGTSNLSSLVMNGGSLDLTNNALVVNYAQIGGADPVGQIASYLAAHAIFSSTVQSLNSSQSALIYAIGYADGADGITNVPSGEIEILPTLAGDAKMQGNVVFGDFQLLSQYFGQPNTTWDEGNFTYGSTTNFGDFQLLSQNFGQSAGGLTSGEVASLNSFAAQFDEQFVPNADGGFSLVSVPEPASCGLLAAAGMGLLARRRRARR